MLKLLIDLHVTNKYIYCMYVLTKYYERYRFSDEGILYKPVELLQYVLATEYSLWIYIMCYTSNCSGIDSSIKKLHNSQQCACRCS